MVGTFLAAAFFAAGFLLAAFLLAAFFAGAFLAPAVDFFLAVFRVPEAFLAPALAPLFRVVFRVAISRF